jgi:hypothetical protein
MIELVLLLAALMAILAYHSFAWGYVFYKTYAWFVLPCFSKLPSLEYLQCVGLLLFVILIFHGSSNDSEEEGTAQAIGKIIVRPWLSLLIAYFIHSLI